MCIILGSFRVATSRGLICHKTKMKIISRRCGRCGKVGTGRVGVRSTNQGCTEVRKVLRQ